MSHEVIQVIKLAKYNRKSHEMIRVTCKCLLTMVNTQEQTLTWNDVISEPNRRLVFTARTGTVYGSSHDSVFESPLYRVQNGYNFESSVIEFGSHKWVWNAVTHNRTHTYKHKCTLHWHVHTDTYVYTYTHTYTSVHTYIYICIN